MDNEDALLNSIFAELDEEELGLSEGGGGKQLGGLEDEDGRGGMDGVRYSNGNGNGKGTQRKPLQTIRNNSQRNPLNLKSQKSLRDKSANPSLPPPSAPNYTTNYKNQAFKDVSCLKASHARPEQSRIKEIDTCDTAVLDQVAWSDEEDTPAQTSNSKDKHKSNSQGLSEGKSNPDHVPISRRFSRCLVTSVSDKALKEFRREKVRLRESHLLHSELIGCATTVDSAC